MAKSMKIELVRSDITLDKLRELEAKEPQNESIPKTLSLSDIHIADRVFQPRQIEYNIADSLYHIKVLAGDLKSQNKPFRALIVVPIGSQFFVIDGHHRMAAYKAVGWSKAVPVKVHKVSLEDAIIQSIQYNNDDKLPMSTQDKLESAWKLVKLDTGLSRARIADVTKAGTNTVANMRKALKALVARGVTIDDELTWRQAYKNYKELPDDFDREAWVSEEAISLRDKLLKATGTKLVENPEVLAVALRMISERLPIALIGEWHEEAYAYVEDHQEAIEEAKRKGDWLDI